MVCRYVCIYTHTHFLNMDYQPSIWGAFIHAYRKKKVISKAPAGKKNLKKINKMILWYNSLSFSLREGLKSNWSLCKQTALVRGKTASGKQWRMLSPTPAGALEPKAKQWESGYNLTHTKFSLITPVKKKKSKLPLQSMNAEIRSHIFKMTLSMFIVDILSHHK